MYPQTLPFPIINAKTLKQFMLIIYLERLNEFAFKHANARKSIATWKHTTENTIWKNKQHVLCDFPKAKMIANNRARFEIVHNTYRLITYID